MSNRTAITVCLVAVAFLVMGVFLAGCRTTTNYTFTVSPTIHSDDAETRADNETRTEQGKSVAVPTEIGRAAKAAVGPAAKVEDAEE